VSVYCYPPFSLTALRRWNRGKKPLDAANSKFVLLEPYSKSNPNLPPHMRPQGENKGTCKSVQVVDSSTFKVTLWSDDVFLGKVRSCLGFCGYVVLSGLCQRGVACCRFFFTA
jgi:hypothetical protein